ncbi:hypothetical protein TRICI_003732 [Trichomonascus ciferrii]|uniref:Uncharacterized protein n=1 Tax=Trichomonascus ciferrii TaxID=44093 RepID=A0A642V345_9ASCO|nr:hypothetical protein TRICI_003732 [Trichomonascus ciferrii]
MGVEPRIQLRVHSLTNPDLQDKYIVPLSDGEHTYGYAIPHPQGVYSLPWRPDNEFVEYFSEPRQYLSIEDESCGVPALKFTEDYCQKGFYPNNDRFLTANGSTNWYACRTPSLEITKTYPVIALYSGDAPSCGCEKIQIWYNRVA